MSEFYANDYPRWAAGLEEAGPSWLTELRRRALISLRFYNEHIPGFEHAMLLAFAPQLGVRDSRRIVGHHQLTGHEMRSGARFVDAIGVAGLTFGAQGSYEIPYRSLVPRDVRGLLVAGR